METTLAAQTGQTETSYLGLRLPHPFVAGASPFGYHLDTIKRLEDAGCAAVVLHSLFEEQITLAAEGRVLHMDPLDPEFAETLGHFPPPAEYPLTPDAYAEHISRAKAAVKIPIVASLNGTTAQSWLRFACMLEQAGADVAESPYPSYGRSLATAAAAVEMDATTEGPVAEVGKPS